MTKNAILRASFWSLAEFGGGQALRLAGNLILTRLLLPEAFGLMALVSIFLQGLGLLTDVGIGASIVQNKRGEEPAFLDTAWTIHIVRGAGIFLCLVALAYPIAHFYEEPRLVPLIAVMGFTAFISGFNSMAVVLAGRKLWLGRVTIMNLASRAAGIAVMIVWAFVSPSVWALVAGNVVIALAVAILSHMILPWWRVRLRWDATAAREIVRFGKWVMLTSALAFLAGQIDRLTLAKLVPLDLVGIYSIGFMWAMLPLQIIQTWTGRVLFPLASQILREGAGSHARLVPYRRRAIWLSAVGLGIFGGLITPVYQLLYTQEYWQATEFLQIILLGVFIGLIGAPYRSLNLALGQPAYTSIGAALSILIFAIAVFPLYERFAAYGIAMAFSISQIGALGADIYGVRKAGLTDLKVDLAAALSGLAIWAALYWAAASLR